MPTRKKEDSMAGTFDGDWQSKLNNVDDGIITVQPPAFTLFLGTHRDTNTGIYGQALDGELPHITFVRRYDRCAYVYDGDIIFVDPATTGGTGDPHYEILNGTCTKICRPVDATTSRAKLTAVADDWTAEKPT
jgi:hypothetical protein